MMSSESLLLVGTAATIGFVHTLLGPDHYVPFVALARAGGWNRAKTLWVTLLCGLGHVLGSVAIGLLGIAAGVALQNLEWLEGIRGDLAGYVLIAFGGLYAAWGLHSALRSKRHEHQHRHEDGTVHSHVHDHQHRHLHLHESGNAAVMTSWTLFTIFVLGPCEPLIPILMFPALQHSWGLLLLVTAVFGLTTIATMLVVTALLTRGLAVVPLGGLERFGHALAGVAILTCGLSVQFLGL